MKLCRTLFFLLFAVTLIGCKEESDIQSPKIFIEKPVEGSHYGVGDKIHIKALVTDNEVVENVEVRLNKLSNNAKVGESIFFNVGSSIYNLDTYYPISDTLLPTDDYYITISAYDGNQEGKAFQKVYISGLPKKKLGDLIVVSNGAQSTLVEINNQSIVNPIHTFNSDYGGVTFSGKYQMIYLCGEIDNKLFGFDIKASTVSWMKTYSSPPSTKTFNYIDVDSKEENIGVSLSAGYTDVLSPFGSEIMSFQPSFGMFPHRHFMEDQLTYIETFSHNGSVHKMETFYSNTAAPFDSKNINFQIIKVFEIDNNKAIIFANVNGSANLYEYTLSSNNIRTADNLINDSLISVLQIDKNLYLAAGIKHVYKYHLSSGSMIEFLTGVRADVIAYDQLNSEIYIGEGSNIQIYDYNTGNLKTTIALSENVEKIIFRYNI